MNVEIVKVGKLECNCYLLDINGNVLVIDPGDDFDKLNKLIGKRKVVGIIVTHYHFDHIGALDEIVNKFDVNVYDKNNLIEGENKVDSFLFNVIFTPGHKEDAITIYFKNDKIMFCGDFIFNDAIGRCDLPGGNVYQMIESLKKMYKYDKDIILYPGHGDKTFLGDELDKNRYLIM